MPTAPHAALASQIIAILDASPLDREHKRRALMDARQHIDKTATTLDTWRTDRAAAGPVGTGKKTDAIKANIPTKPAARKK